MIRQVESSALTEMVAKLCKKSNIWIGDDISKAMDEAYESEISPEGKGILSDLRENIKVAKNLDIPICQDTGMAVVFLRLGQDVHITGDPLDVAINKGVAKGYTEGYLRASIVNDPFKRENTGDNTPAVIHIEMAPGDEIEITVAPKGFGSENMSCLKMLKPVDGIEGVKKFVLDAVMKAGPNPCPPVILGVGIGGTMEKAAIIAKKALLRPVGKHNELEHVKELEKDLLAQINRTGIGPGGLGGLNTALAVNIEVYPTHIAGLPVAVNIGCHATRHACAKI